MDHCTRGRIQATITQPRAIEKVQTHRKHTSTNISHLSRSHIDRNTRIRPLSLPTAQL